VSQQALLRHNKHTETKKKAECIHAWRHSWADKSSHRKPKAMLSNKRIKPAKEGHAVTPKSVIGEASEAENSLASPGHGRQETKVQSMHKTKIIDGKEL